MLWTISTLFRLVDLLQLHNSSFTWTWYFFSLLIIIHHKAIFFTNELANVNNKKRMRWMEKVTCTEMETLNCWYNVFWFEHVSDNVTAPAEQSRTKNQQQQEIHLPRRLLSHCVLTPLRTQLRLDNSKRTHTEDCNSRTHEYEHMYTHTQTHPWTIFNRYTWYVISFNSFGSFHSIRLYLLDNIYFSLRIQCKQLHFRLTKFI